MRYILLILFRFFGFKLSTMFFYSSAESSSPESENSTDEEYGEERDQFTAQLYKFHEERGFFNVLKCDKSTGYYSIRFPSSTATLRL